MTEATVVNLFFLVRVFLVGGILFLLPRLIRKGLLFGVYVGEEFAEGNAAKRLGRSWNLGLTMVIALSLLVGLGISGAGRPVTGNLTGTVILLLASAGLYVRTYYRARGLAPPIAARQADRATAPITGSRPRGSTLAAFALGICILVGLATVFYAKVSYEAMPERVPNIFGQSGAEIGWSHKSFVAIMVMPSLSLLICPMAALMALLTTRAKLSVRGGSGGGSAEVQIAFRATMANLLSWIALFVCAVLTLMSVQIIRIGLGEIRSLGTVIWWLAGAFFIFVIGNMIRVFTRYGQGGALMESGSAGAPLTNGLADNTHWFWGAFYVDKEDPSILVEKRFGIGYTLNYGNRTAIAIVVSFLVLTLGLIAFVAIGANL